MYTTFNDARRTEIVELLKPCNVKGVSYGEVTRKDAFFIVALASFMTGFTMIGMFFVL
jgi:hypothetical protein